MATVGELTNVPAPGAPILSQWANDASNRIVQRFASKTALDAWAAANGSVAFTTDTSTLWVRRGGVWTPQVAGTIVARTSTFSASSIGSGGLQVASVSVTGIANRHYALSGYFVGQNSATAGNVGLIMRDTSTTITDSILVAGVNAYYTLAIVGVIDCGASNRTINVNCFPYAATSAVCQRGLLVVTDAGDASV